MTDDAGPGDHDVIIVLGASLAADGAPMPALIRRMDHAIRLFEAGAAGHLLLSGGPAGHETPEAVVMETMAVDADVPRDRIVTETRSTRTLENAACCRAVMESRGWRRALVVTDPYHMPRALFAFRGLGVAAEGSGAGGAWVRMSWRRKVRTVLWEAAAFVGYVPLVLRHRHGLRAAERAKRIVARHRGR